MRVAVSQNQDWLDQLRGDRGEVEQELAHQALAVYLYDQVYYYLKDRQAQGNPWRLAGLSQEELPALAHDFVQQTLEKLVDDEFALLTRFRGEGRFISWMKMIVINEARQELRSSYWNRAVSWSLSEEPSQLERNMAREEVLSADPEKTVMQKELIRAFQTCQAQLDPELFKALFGLVVDRQRATELAVSLQLGSAGKVYQNVKRAKRRLRTCLQKAGWVERV